LATNDAAWQPLLVNLDLHYMSFIWLFCAYFMVLVLMKLQGLLAMVEALYVAK